MTTITKTSINYAKRRQLDLTIEQHDSEPDREFLWIWGNDSDMEPLAIYKIVNPSSLNFESQFLLQKPVCLSSGIYSQLPLVLKDEKQLRVTLDFIAVQLNRVKERQTNVELCNLATVTEDEQKLVKIWNNSETDATQKLNKLLTFAILLNANGNIAMSERVHFLIKTFEKKLDLQFLKDFEKLNLLSKAYPDALPLAVELEKNNHPELYPNEPTLCNEQSQAINEIDKDVNRDDKKEIDCSTCDQRIGTFYCMTSVCIPKYEKEQGGSPKKTNSHKTFVGLDDSLSHPIIENIEIKGLN